jgi:hypothetical protein
MHELNDVLAVLTAEEAVLVLDIHDLNPRLIDLIGHLNVTVKVFGLDLVAYASLIIVQVVVVHLPVVVDGGDHREPRWIDRIVRIHDIIGEGADPALAGG